MERGKKITVNSISGGKTSAYIAANYPADYNVFALVRTDDKKCLYPDPKLRQMVSDRIGTEFIGTLEDDIIINTIFDLEQYIGTRIDWVSGKSFDDVIKKKGGYLPNLMQRFCTTEMKLIPLFNWWHQTIGSPVEMRIGFRANEQRRAKTMNEKLNSNGLLEIKATVSKHPNGRNKWQVFEWQKPEFPLIKDGIFKDNIEQYWTDKAVRFAWMNNCVGCFHKDPLLLRKMWDLHPTKLQWFADQERKRHKRDIWLSGTKPDVSINNHLWDYEKIKNWKIQIDLFNDDFNDCDSGYCGL